MDVGQALVNKRAFDVRVILSGALFVTSKP